VQELDGHDFNQSWPRSIVAPFEPGRPSMMVAHTVKEKAFSFMEDNLEWHYRPPTMMTCTRSARDWRMRNAFVRSLATARGADPRLVLLTGDLGYKILIHLQPNSLADLSTSGCRANLIACRGPCAGGLRPFAIQLHRSRRCRCPGQIRNDVCYHNLPVTIVGSVAV